MKRLILDLSGGVFLFSVMLYFLFQITADHLQYRHNQSWPATEGVITKSRIITDYRSSGDPPTTEKYYKLEVSYSYTVDDTTYIGDRISPSGNVSSRNHRTVEDIFVKYPPNKSLNVFYDPQNPERAILESGPLKIVWLTLSVFGLSFIISIAWIVKTIDKYRKNKTA